MVPKFIRIYVSVSKAIPVVLLVSKITSGTPHMRDILIGDLPVSTVISLLLKGVNSQINSQ